MDLSASAWPVDAVGHDPKHLQFLGEPATDVGGKIESPLPACFAQLNFWSMSGRPWQFKEQRAPPHHRQKEGIRSFQRKTTPSQL